MADIDHDVTVTHPDGEVEVIGTHMTGYYRNGRKYTHFVTASSATPSGQTVYHAYQRQDKHAHPAPRS